MGIFSELEDCNFMQYWKCRSAMHLKRHKDTDGFVLYFIPKNSVREICFFWLLLGIDLIHKK